MSIFIIFLLVSNVDIFDRVESAELSAIHSRSRVKKFYKQPGNESTPDLTINGESRRFLDISASTEITLNFSISDELSESDQRKGILKFKENSVRI